MAGPEGEPAPPPPPAEGEGGQIVGKAEGKGLFAPDAGKGRLKLSSESEMQRRAIREGGSMSSPDLGGKLDLGDLVDIGSVRQAAKKQEGPREIAAAEASESRTIAPIETSNAIKEAQKAQQEALEAAKKQIVTISGISVKDFNFDVDAFDFSQENVEQKFQMFDLSEDSTLSLQQVFNALNKMASNYAKAKAKLERGKGYNEETLVAAKQEAIAALKAMNPEDLGKLVALVDTVTTNEVFAKNSDVMMENVGDVVLAAVDQKADSTMIASLMENPAKQAKAGTAYAGGAAPGTVPGEITE